MSSVYPSPTEDTSPQVESLAAACLRNSGYMVSLGGGYTWVSADAFYLYQLLFERLASGDYEIEDGHIYTCITPYEVAAEISCNIAALRTAVEQLSTRGIVSFEEWPDGTWDIQIVLVERVLQQQWEDEHRPPPIKLPPIGVFIQKHGATCTYCKLPGTEKRGPDGKSWARDHIVASSKGGADTLDNLTLACWTCNQHKGTMSAEDFVAKLARKAQAASA